MYYVLCSIKWCTVPCGVWWCMLVHNGVWWCIVVEDGVWWCRVVQNGVWWCNGDSTGQVWVVYHHDLHANGHPHLLKVIQGFCHRARQSHKTTSFWDPFCGSHMVHLVWKTCLPKIMVA